MNKSTSGGYIKGLGKRANAVLSILVLLLSTCMILPALICIFLKMQVIS